MRRAVVAERAKVHERGDAGRQDHELESRGDAGPPQDPKLREGDAAGHGHDHGEHEGRGQRRAEHDRGVDEPRDGTARKIGQRPYRRSRRAYDASA